MKKFLTTISVLIVLLITCGVSYVYLYDFFKYSIIEFSDDFEYTDSPQKHGWKYVFPGASDSSLFTTDEFAQSGKRCLKGFMEFPPKHTRFGLQYSFKDNEFGKALAPDDTLEIIVHWYDDATTGSDFNFHPKIYFLDFEGVTRHIGFSDSKDRYSYSPMKGSSWESKYFSTRKDGWHEIKYYIHNNTINIYFDGELLVEDHSEIENITEFNWFSAMITPNQHALSWIDNVIFIRKTKK